MHLYDTACGGEQLLARRFQDDDDAWEPCRTGQWMSAAGEGWGISLSEAP